MKEEGLPLGWLCVILLLIVSSILVNPIRIYLSPALLSYYRLSLSSQELQRIAAFSISFQVLGLLLCVIFIYSSRILHRTYIYISLYIFLCAVFLLLIHQNVVLVIIALSLFNFGLGLISIPAITSVCSRIHLLNTISEREIITRDKDDTLLQRSKRPIPYSISIMLLIPLIVGLVIITQSLYAIYIVFALLNISMYFILKNHREFGAFHTTFNPSMFRKNIVTNSMFWFILFMSIIAVFLEYFITFSFPYFINIAFRGIIELAEQQKIKTIFAIVLPILRIILLVFTAVSLNQIPPRRIIFLSGITLSLTIAFFHYSNAQSRVFLIITMLMIIPIILLALLKSAANFIQLSLLPVMIACVSLLGNILLGLSFFYFSAENTHAIVLHNKAWSLFLILAIPTVSLLFFAQSYRKNLQIIALKKE